MLHKEALHGPKRTAPAALNGTCLHRQRSCPDRVCATPWPLCSSLRQSRSQRHAPSIGVRSRYGHPKLAMISYSVLLTGLVTLGLGPPLAGAECIDCDLGEETVLLQRMKSSEDHTALEADEWRWQKQRYPKWNCEDDVRAAQQDWRGAILDISAAYRENTSSGEFVTVAIDAIENLYGYDIGPVVFKPTLAEEEPFRPTFDGALSYFVGNDAMQAFNGGGGIPEDKGFAIAGGDTWSKVLFFQ